MVGRAGEAGLALLPEEKQEGCLGWLRPPSECPMMSVAPERNPAPQLVTCSSAYSLQSWPRGSELEQGP